MRTILRCPFTRGSLVRRTVIGIDCGIRTCAWCGNLRFTKSKRDPRQFLYQYGWDADDKAQVAWDEKLFDSIGCRKAFYGG